MTVLEKAIRTLASALDELEERIETGVDSQNLSSEAQLSARAQARVARDHIEEASRELSASISDLQSRLAAGDEQNEG